jgi:hypothetical protein
LESKPPGPVSMSWDDVHRLELQLRARAAAIGRRGKDPTACPVCGWEIKEGEGGMQLGGIAVHVTCLPALRSVEPPTSSSTA